MDLLSVKQNLDKYILFTDDRLGIKDKEYKLSSIVAQKGDNGNFKYSVELIDIKGNSVIRTTLDKIKEKVI